MDKKNEAERQALGWDSKREPTKINYKYASEADMLNMALFGKTAKQWREENGITKENIYAIYGCATQTCDACSRWSSMRGLHSIYRNQAKVEV